MGTSSIASSSTSSTADTKTDTKLPASTKRTADQASISGGSPQGKRPSTQSATDAKMYSTRSEEQTPNEASICGAPPQAQWPGAQSATDAMDSSTHMDTNQYIYAVVQNSIGVCDDDDTKGTEKDMEVIAVYADLGDANRRVIREWEDWEGPSPTVGDGSSFQFEGEKYGWFIDSDRRNEGIRIRIEEWRVLGRGSEQNERLRLIPGELGYSDQKWSFDEDGY